MGQLAANAMSRLSFLKILQSTINSSVSQERVFCSNNLAPPIVWSRETNPQGPSFLRHASLSGALTKEVVQYSKGSRTQTTSKRLVLSKSTLLQMTTSMNWSHTRGVVSPCRRQTSNQARSQISISQLRTARYKRWQTMSSCLPRPAASQPTDNQR